MPTLEARISSSADDAEERASGSMKFTSSDLELVDDNPSKPDQTIGLRFNGLDIPQGAIITSAYLQFQVDEVSAGGATLQIQGEDADNAAAFANTANDVSSRQATTATVTWSPNEWLTVGAAGADQQSADISSIIQEIVSRAGWTANNSIALIITGSGARTAEALMAMRRQRRCFMSNGRCPVARHRRALACPPFLATSTDCTPLCN